MKTIFAIINPDEIQVRLTVEMTVGEARNIRETLEKSDHRPYDASTNFKWQLETVIKQAEVHFTKETRHTERPDG